MAEPIQYDDVTGTFVCSPNQAAYALDMSVRQLWRERIETGELRVVYLPSGNHEIFVPRHMVVNSLNPLLGQA